MNTQDDQKPPTEKAITPITDIFITEFLEK